MRGSLFLQPFNQELKTCMASTSNYVVLLFFCKVDKAYCITRYTNSKVCIFRFFRVSLTVFKFFNTEYVYVQVMSTCVT